MKQTILTLGILFGVLTSCTQTKEEVLKDVFIDYVQTDFDDPNEFKEITSIEPIDTLDKSDGIRLVRSMERISILYSEGDKQMLKEFEEKLQTDKTCIITYEVKVRIERYGRKSVQKYYILDDGLDYKVQDHLLGVDEVPEPYKSFFKFANDVVNLATGR